MKRIGLMTALSVLLLSVSACSGNGGNVGSSPSAANGQGEPSAGAQQTGASTDGKGAGAGTDAPAVAREEIKLPTGPVKLVVASFEPSEQLKQAVKKYEQAHTNVTVELQAAQTEFKDLDSQIANIEKYVAKTNTALLSGKGPDVMELDLLPKEKLVGRGLLANLGDWMDRDAAFNKADYFANVLDNMQIAGGLYAMPLSFYPVTLIGDKAAIDKDGGVKDGDWTWDEFAESAQRLIQKGTHPHALANTPDYMLSELVDERYAQFVDEAGRRASFDSPGFAELMTQVKQLFDDGVVIDLMKANFRSESLADNPKINTYFQSTQIPSPMEFLMLMDQYDGNARVYTKPHAKEMGPGGYFAANQTMGINAASPVKEQAWDFVKFLLSEQGAADPDISLGHTGFPISRIAYDKEIEKLRDEGEVPGYKNGPAESDPFKVNEAHLDLLDGIVTAAVHPVGQSTKIGDIISEESKAFFTGQKSAEAVAKLIQNKVTTYLNE
ncbi:ABC transporter substrate-binding protein [Cohnella hashimotonis]|uniref:Extracellular solute-binding protein n=1 Tax=Cohnella hashimotonis TaxID=2826895 RepID=A0ABT6TRD8_9BACL|nr:extracellular solute-binding protein [Cohnella hashimotonis]MDI4649289.1 extracellular solute-binding protein [Cohnella hashimotonis]